MSDKHFGDAMTQSLTHEQAFKALGGCDLTFSVFDGKLLFLHSDFMSGQYDIDLIGVDVMKQSDHVKVAFMSTLSRTVNNYASYYFEASEFEALRDYFRQLKFPVPEHIYAGWPTDSPKKQIIEPETK